MQQTHREKDCLKSREGTLETKAQFSLRVERF